MIERMSKLTHFEKAIKGISAAISIPFAPLTVKVIQENYRGVVMRFGKVDRILEPGLRWVPFGGNCKEVFIGARTHSYTNLRVLDANGTPIIISAIVKYNIGNPENFVINANSNFDVFDRFIQDSIRSICNKVTYDSTISNKLSDTMIDTINTSYLYSFGFQNIDVKIIEANYAPEIMQHMLMKQQAKAYVEARKEIVEGAIGVAKEAIKSFPEMSKESQEAIISNLLTTLTSGNSPQTVLQMK